FIYFAGFPWLFYRIWRSRRGSDIFLFVWAAIDLYLAISAVRFQSQSVPTFAVLAGATTVWIVRQLNLPNIVERYRMGGGGWRGLRRSTGVVQVLTVLFIGSLIIAPGLYLAVDAAIPANTEFENTRAARRQASEDVTRTAQGLGVPPEAVREVQLAANLSADAGDFRGRLDDVALNFDLDDSTTDALYAAAADDLAVVGRYQKRLGAFGQSFLTEDWRRALVNISREDGSLAPPYRPAFLAWWDYGHWAIDVSEHPTVADNFQNGYRPAGAFLAARNESHAVQIVAARHAKLFTKDEFAATLTAQGLPAFNASRHYDAALKETYPFLRFDADARENLAASVAWLASIEDADGKRIRYFAADSRMLPLDLPGNQGIESPGIFYAPVTLAGGEPDDYVEPVVVNLQTGQKVSEAQLRQLRESLAQVDLGERLDYKDPFFSSMFYRAYLGLPVQNPIVQGTVERPNPLAPSEFQAFYRGGEDMLTAPASVTGGSFLQVSPRGELETITIAPGFGLRHFRLTYANPTVRVLEYTPGAVIEGTASLAGQPLAGARVTVFDDAGGLVRKADPAFFERLGLEARDLDIPHDSVVTDGQGRFRLTAPFSLEGGITVKLTQEIARGTPALYASEVVEISRADAESGRTFAVDFDVEPASWRGAAFVDENGDGARNATEPALEGVTVSVQGRNATTDAGGAFRLEGLAPGAHAAQAAIDGYRLAPGAGRVELVGGDELERDLPFQHLPVQVTGGAEDTDGDSLEGVNVVLEPAAGSATARRATAVSGVNGTLALLLQPGTYDVTGN
ncbi:MAG: hypothetical protein ACREQ9_22915, partial [Candidatus Binatia bacterium]